MTFTHEDANARLLDLVYDEAPPAEREALQAHVAACERCQAELVALGDTRARLRVALDDEPAPAGARAHILAAAAAEVSDGAQAGAAATAPPARGNDPASRAERAGEQPSFWERLRRKWTLPTLATVGALAVAMLVLGPKMFSSPEKVMERGQQDLFPKDEEKLDTGATAQPAAPPAVQPRPPSTMPAEMVPEPKPAREMDKRELSPQMRARIESIRRYNNKAHNSLGDMLGNQPAFKADKLGGAPASQGIGNLRADDLGRGGGGVARGAVGGTMGGATAGPKAAEKKPAKGGLDSLQEAARAPAAEDRYASPPAGWKSAPAAAPPPPPVAKKRTVNDDMLEGLAPTSRSAPAPSRVAEAERGDDEAASVAEGDLAKRKAAPAPAPAAPRAEPAAAGKAASAPAGARKEKDAAPPYEALAKRADELFAAQRWAEAAAIYNELVRRYPTAAPAILARWRLQSAVAQREAAPKSGRAAKAEAPAAKAATPKKSTSSSDALDGL
jgi:hypothetical protein